MRVAIVGSRKYNKMWNVKQYVANIHDDFIATPPEIITGGAEGPDTWAAQEARRLNLKVTIIRPDYAITAVKRLAPLARNIKIVQACDYLVAFWDGKSKGTLDIIMKATEYGKMVVINPVDQHA